MTKALWHRVELFVNNHSICQRNAAQQISSASRHRLRPSVSQLLQGMKESPHVLYLRMTQSTNEWLILHERGVRFTVWISFPLGNDTVIPY